MSTSRSTLFANSAIFVALKDRTQFHWESDKRSFNKAFLYFTISSFLHIQMILCSVCRRLTLGLTNITSESFIMLTSLYKIKCCENNHV